ncbi:MAG: pyridoxal-phosphate dependent enzyme [Planctomycetota bacterium]|jgi:threonine synthase|nr:pyridoxal-phosphate dependent enzyme [Planctomycetota bacterium]MDP7252682.1 pyridoxal-phosphate dependent enzyme [Planctomycetota bacterium]
MPLTLGEGNTPLVRSRSIGPDAGIPNLYFKLEAANPTGSFKDRFGCAAVNHMLDEGKTLCVATSSGNTGASLAGYCAAASITCHIAIVETAPFGKLRQMLAYGAHLYRIKGFGLDIDATAGVMDKLVELSQQEHAMLQISAFKYSPTGMAGVRSLAYELAEQQPDGIDHVFCQAGGGGMAVAVAEAFSDLVREGTIEKCPAVEVVQPEGNNTMAGPLREGLEIGRQVNCTSTVSGLQVATNIDGDRAIQSCRATGGTGHVVPDDLIYEAQSRLAKEEGIFSEPAGATSLAGALSAKADSELKPDAVVVCPITGIGFKDEHSVEEMTKDALHPILDSVGAFEDAIRSQTPDS